LGLAEPSSITCRLSGGLNWRGWW